jgi:hypothetical protein
MAWCGAKRASRRPRGIRFHSTHHLRHGLLPAGRRTSSSMTRVSCIRSTIKTKAPGGAFRQEALRVRGWGVSIPSSSLTRTAVICSFPPVGWPTTGRGWSNVSPVQRDDFFPGQLIGGTPAHARQHIALLDVLAILRPNSATCANTDHDQPSASYSERHRGCGCGASAASIRLRCRCHFVGAGRLKRQTTLWRPVHS